MRVVDSESKGDDLRLDDMPDAVNANSPTCQRDTFSSSHHFSFFHIPFVFDKRFAAAKMFTMTDPLKLHPLSENLTFSAVVSANDRFAKALLDEQHDLECKECEDDSDDCENYHGVDESSVWGNVSVRKMFTRSCFVPNSVVSSLSVLDSDPFLKMASPDAILGIAEAFRTSTDPRKVNVCVGAYRDENGKPWVLPSVRQAERILLEQDVKEYLPIIGDSEFIEAAVKFAYGSDMSMDHLAAVQTVNNLFVSSKLCCSCVLTLSSLRLQLSGTGACRVGGEFLAQFLPGRSIYVPGMSGSLRVVSGGPTELTD